MHKRLTLDDTAQERFFAFLLSYVRTRLPMYPLLLPLLGAFMLSWWLCGTRFGAVGLGSHPYSFSLGLVSFGLLFFQLRVIDDLDDLDQDHGECGCLPILRRRLLLILGTVPALLLIFNWYSESVLMTVAVATLMSYIGPFVIKRHLNPSPGNLILAWIVFEGTPASFFIYVYVAWAAAVGPVPIGATFSTPAAFWIGYQFWKFSRKLHLDAFLPYFLTRRSCTRVLTGLMLAAVAVNWTLSRTYSLSLAYASYAVLLPLVFALGVQYDQTSHLNGSRVGSGTEPARAPWWAGMTYLTLVEIGLLVELALHQDPKPL